MAVPDFQSWLLPLLRRLSNGEVHRMTDLYEQLIQYGVGVGVEATYEVKRIDNDYFEI